MVQASELRQFAGRFPTGVTVVTTCDAMGQLYGLTMNAVTSLSLDPPLFLICVDLRSDSLPALLESQVFAINILARGQEATARTFAGKGREKFVGLCYALHDLGVPLLEGAQASAVCRVVATHPGGDHTIILGQVEEVRVQDREPLLYYRGSYVQLSVCSPS